MKVFRTILKASAAGSVLAGGACYSISKNGDGKRINDTAALIAWSGCGAIAGAIIGGLTVTARAIRNR